MNRARGFLDVLLIALLSPSTWSIRLSPQNCDAATSAVAEAW